LESEKLVFPYAAEVTAVRLLEGVLNLVSSLVGNRQFLSALRSSAGQYFSSVGSAHSLSEPVLIFSLTIRRLIRSFHDIPQLLRPAKLGTLSVNAKMFSEILHWPAYRVRCRSPDYSLTLAKHLTYYTYAQPIKSIVLPPASSMLHYGRPLRYASWKHRSQTGRIHD
jgi:hypothetical protein